VRNVLAELSGPRVLAAVEDLGTQRASGVLEVTGVPGGTIYLDHGQVTFAQATWVPGLAARLPGVLQPGDGLQELLNGWDQQDPGIAPLLLRCGHISTTALHTLLRSIVVDAFLVLTAPRDPDPGVSAIRFASAQTRWDGAFPRLSIASVRAEAAQHGKRFADRSLAPTALVRLRDLGSDTAILTREQWAVSCQISGDTPVANVAARCGIALADAVERISQLMTAGMCAPVGTGVQSVTGAPTRIPAQAPRQIKAEQAPTADLLRQVLNGLRNLS